MRAMPLELIDLVHSLIPMGSFRWTWWAWWPWTPCFQDFRPCLLVVFISFWTSVTKGALEFRIRCSLSQLSSDPFLTSPPLCALHLFIPHTDICIKWLFIAWVITKGFVAPFCKQLITSMVIETLGYIIAYVHEKKMSVVEASISWLKAELYSSVTRLLLPTLLLYYNKTPELVLSKGKILHCYCLITSWLLLFFSLVPS